MKAATMYADQSGEQEQPQTVEIPDDLTAVEDADLADLKEQAIAAFDQVYGDGKDLTDEQVSTLTELTAAIERIGEETQGREQAATERAEKAADLAGRVRPAADQGDDTGGDGEDTAAQEPEGEQQAAEPVAASGRTLRIPRQQVAPKPEPEPEKPGIKDRLFAAGGPRRGEGIDWKGAAEIVSASVKNFPASQYQNAARQGMSMSHRDNIAAVHKTVPDEYRITSSDPEHVSEVIDRATKDARGAKAGVVASGGFCAPSQIDYDILDLSGADGLWDGPEVGISRGGLQATTGASFADIFANAGFGFTEAQDQAGEYAPGDAPAWAATTAYTAGDYVSLTGGEVLLAVQGGTSGSNEPAAPVYLGGTVTDGDVVWQRVRSAQPLVVGDKPCLTVPCPEFTDYRLAVEGVCITGGLLQAVGYPEAVADAVQKAMTAHPHRVSGAKIAQIEAGSTQVALNSPQVGAAAPLLTAIELQATHMRYVNRLSDSTTISVVLPRWAKGAIRADLSRRLGVDLISVSDARINEWLASKNVQAQFVFNYQDLTSNPADFLSWPTQVSFLVYPAGTWVAGGADIISLDTIYDSKNLGQNNYVALFTEEGYVMIKKFADSREVTVPIQPDGATHAGVLIDADGTPSA